MKYVFHKAKFIQNKPFVLSFDNMCFHLFGDKNILSFFKSIVNC